MWKGRSLSLPHRSMRTFRHLRSLRWVGPRSCMRWMKSPLKAVYKVITKLQTTKQHNSCMSIVLRRIWASHAGQRMCAAPSERIMQQARTCRSVVRHTGFRAPFLCVPQFGRTCWTCLRVNPPLMGESPPPKVETNFGQLIYTGWAKKTAPIFLAITLVNMDRFW